MVLVVGRMILVVTEILAKIESTIMFQRFNFITCVVNHLSHEISHWCIFVQIVGVTDREMKAAQQWKGASVLSMLSRIPE